MRSAVLNSGFLRFLVVGGLSLAADTGSLFVLHGLLHLWLALATVLAYGIAFFVNFGLNRAWVFESDGSLAGQLPKYFGLVLVNLAVTVVAMQSLTWLGMPYLYAKLAIAMVLAVANFFVSRRWIFA